MDNQSGILVDTSYSSQNPDMSSKDTAVLNKDEDNIVKTTGPLIDTTYPPETPRDHNSDMQNGGNVHHCGTSNEVIGGIQNGTVRHNKDDQSEMHNGGYATGQHAGTSKKDEVILIGGVQNETVRVVEKGTAEMLQGKSEDERLVIELGRANSLTEIAVDNSEMPRLGAEELNGLKGEQSQIVPSIRPYYNYQKPKYFIRWHTPGCYFFMPGFILAWFCLVATGVYAPNDRLRELYPLFVGLACLGLLLCLVGLAICGVWLAAQHGRLDLVKLKRKCMYYVACERFRRSNDEEAVEEWQEHPTRCFCIILPNKVHPMEETNDSPRTYKTEAIEEASEAGSSLQSNDVKTNPQKDNINAQETAVQSNAIKPNPQEDDANVSSVSVDSDVPLNSTPPEANKMIVSGSNVQSNNKKNNAQEDDNNVSSVSVDSEVPLTSSSPSEDPAHKGSRSQSKVSVIHVESAPMDELKEGDAAGDTAGDTAGEAAGDAAGDTAGEAAGEAAVDTSGDTGDSGDPVQPRRKNFAMTKDSGHTNSNESGC